MKEHNFAEALISKLLSRQFKIIWLNYFKIRDFKNIDYSANFFRNGSEDKIRMGKEEREKSARER